MTPSCQPLVKEMTMLNEIIQQITTLDDTQIHAILTDILAKLTKNVFLDDVQTQQLMTIIMLGKCPEPLLAAIIVAWRMKGENVTEIAAAAAVMRAFSHKVNLHNHHAIDIVGTGGDGANLFNVSTAASFVVASAGVPVAKHGSTGVSSSSGASDVLTSLGVNLQLNSEQIAQSVDKHGIGFMFAPNHHPAMRHAKSVRAMLKIRTIFNILGPLTNPAGVPYTLLGVFHPELCELLAGGLSELGSRHVWAVCAEDGLDEISLAVPTKVTQIKNGVANTFIVTPEQVGISRQSLEGLTVTSPEQSAKLIECALMGASTDKLVQKAQDMIALNAGAALYIADRAKDYQSGVTLAKEIIQSGQAHQKIAEFAKFTQTHL